MTTSSTVSTGTLSTAGGTARLFGSASNLDTDKLVEALTTAKRQPAVRLETKISTNEKKIAAYTELGGLLGKLQTAVAGLRNPPGLLGSRDNLFEAKDVFLSSDTGTAAASLVSVAASNDVQPGKLQVQVRQLASARKFAADSVGDSRANLATALNGGNAFSGSFTLGTAGGGSATIAVDGTMSMDDVRAAINAQRTQTGVSANLVKVNDSDYRLVLTADQTGKEVALTQAAGDPVLARLGLSDDGGQTFKHALAAAQPALLDIDGVTISRPGNQITDAIDGLTFDLVKAEPGTTVTVDVQRSLGGVRDQIGAVVDAYNGIRDFVAKQGTLDSTGNATQDAVLFGDTLLRSLTQSLGEIISRPVAGVAAGDPNSLAGIGLKLDTDNKLQIDGTTLEQALLGKLDSVRNVMEFRFTASSGSLRIFDRSNDLTDNAFKVEVTDADGDGVPEAATADGVALDLVGNRLVGRSGTAYAGLQMIWGGQGSESIDVTATQGAADKLYNLIRQANDSVNGSLKGARDSLQQQDTDYHTQIGTIDDRVDRYRDQLLAKFQAMETALSLANSMMQQVKAAFGGSNGS